MRAFSAIQWSTTKLSQPLLRPASSYSIRRTSICFPRQQILFRAKCDGVHVRVVPTNLLTAEKEEAKAVLTLFLRKQGLSNTVAVRIINKTEIFIDYLLSKLHSVHKTWYLVGRDQLTTLEIRDALVLYLESLQEEHGEFFVDVVEIFFFVDVVEIFPNPPRKERLVTPTIPIISVPNTKKEKAMARVSEVGPEGELPPKIVYLMELGVDLNQIKAMIFKFPAFASYSLEGKIRPTIEFLLDLGLRQSDIPAILHKLPQLISFSIKEKLIPKMTYLEHLGVDKKQWPKVIHRFPALLTHSRQKVKATVDYLKELGLSEESVGKILTRYPRIVSNCVDKLHVTAEYFCSMGVDVAVLLLRSPETFSPSIEGNLKPVTEFFLEKRYGIDDVGTMVSRYGTLYAFSLTENLIPKWEFFLTMHYPMSVLVKFPHYFGYSLEKRIKPRYARVKESGVKIILNQISSVSDSDFERILQKKINKMLETQAATDDDDLDSDLGSLRL